MARLNVVKSDKTSLPTYEITKTSTSKKKQYALSKNGRSPFLVYEGTIIRKSTALFFKRMHKFQMTVYWGCVQTSQAIYFIHRVTTTYPKLVFKPEIYVYSAIPSPLEAILGHLVQFSYLYGTKKQREYSSNYCDLTKENCNDIGVFVNCFLPTHSVESDGSDCNVIFKPAGHLFTTGYLGMSNYYKKIKDSYLVESDDSSNAFLKSKKGTKCIIT